MNQINLKSFAVRAELNDFYSINREENIYDVIIVGQGIAGSCLGHHLLREKKKFLILDSPKKNNCSLVAAGLVNPITGKRITKTWLAETLFSYSITFYQELEKELNTQFFHPKEIIRPAADVQQVNETLGRISDGFLGDFISYEENDREIEKFSHVASGFYRVKSGGYLDLPVFLDKSRGLFKEHNSFKEDWISEDDVTYQENSVTIKHHQARNIVWCTGNYATQENSFNYLPFKLTRGEMMKFSSAELINEFIFNKNFFVIPRGKEFVSGATYSRDVTKKVTEDGLNDMTEKLSSIIKSSTTITKHYYGIRPTVADRKPYLGIHPERPCCYIFNGLGSKGVTQGPYFAKELLNFIFDGGSLTPEVDIKRHHKRYFNRET